MILFAQVVVVATFAASALAKARDLDGFHRTLVAFRIAGDRSARRLAPVVLAVEVLAVLLTLLVPYAGLALGAALLIAYTGLLVSVRAHGTSVGCHCFGRTPEPVSWWDVARNLVLLAGASSWIHVDVVPAVGAGVALVLLAVHLRTVADALRAPLLVEESP